MAQTTTLRAYLGELEDLLAAGASTKVITHCRHILRHFPQNVDAYRLLARALYDRGQRDGTDAHFDEALEVLQRVLSVFPNDAIAHKYVALLFQGKEQIDRAMWHFERAFEQSPSDRDLQHHIHQLHAQHGASHSATKIHLTRGALARQHFSARLFDQSLIELRAAIDESPDRLDLHVLLAETLWETQHPIEAGELAVQILKKLPYCLPANRILARLWLDNERPTDAQIFLERIESLDPYAARRVLSVDANAPDTVVLDRLDYDVQSQAALSTESPSWLSELDSLGGAGQAGVGPFAGLGADWLGGAATDDSPSSVLSTPEEAASEDTFADWLSEMSRDTDTPDQPARDAVFTAQEGASGAEDLPTYPDAMDVLAQMPDQIESLLPPDDPQSHAAGEDFRVSDAFDDWLADVGQEVGVAADGAPDLPSDWFLDDADEAEDITDDFPVSADMAYGVADSALVSSELDDIGTEMPEWLSGALDVDSEEPGAVQPADADSDIPEGWLSGTDDSPDDLLGTGDRALTDALAGLLADEPESEIALTPDTPDDSDSLAPNWLDDAMRSEVAAPGTGSLPGQDEHWDESVLWSADEDDLTTIQSLEQDDTALSDVLDTIALGSDIPSDDDPLWGELLDEAAAGYKHGTALTDLDDVETAYAEDVLMASDLPSDLGMGELEDTSVQPDMDSLLSETADELLSALAAAESENKHAAEYAVDSADEAALTSVPDWLADVAPLTDDDLVEDVEDVDGLFAGQVLEEALERAGDAAPSGENQEGLGWLRATDAEEDWLSTLSAADTADVLDMVDMSADDLSYATIGEPENGLPSDADIQPDLDTDDRGLDDRQEPESPPERAYSAVDTGEQAFDDEIQAAELYFNGIESAEDVHGYESTAVAEDDSLAQLPGQEPDTVQTVVGGDESVDSAAQLYDPYEEGRPENVPHYESAHNTGILQPDELPAWMKAFTGEEMAAELDDDAEFDIVERDSEEELETEFAMQDTAESVASAADETDVQDDAPPPDVEDYESESPEDLIADVLAADPADGIPAWLLAITESEADKLDRTLFDDEPSDSDAAEEMSDLVADPEADWLHDISDVEPDTFADSVPDVTARAQDLDTVFFDGDAADESADEDEFSVSGVEQGAAWHFDSDVRDEVSDELSAELEVATDATLFGSDDGEDLAFEPETERSFELSVDNTEQTTLPRDMVADQESLALDSDSFVDADTVQQQQDESFAEQADMSHTTLHDRQIEETALTEPFEEDEFHLDDIVPVWLRRPKESDLLEDAFDAMHEDMPEPEPPEWLRDVAEDNEQTGDNDS